MDGFDVRMFCGRSHSFALVNSIAKRSRGDRAGGADANGRDHQLSNNSLFSAAAAVASYATRNRF